MHLKINTDTNTTRNDTKPSVEEQVLSQNSTTTTTGGLVLAPLHLDPPPTSDDDLDEVLILYWIPFWGSTHYKWFEPWEERGCRRGVRKCRQTWDHSLIGQADAIVFEGQPNIGFPVRKPNQPWVIAEKENLAWHYQVEWKDKNYISNFNYTMTYMMNSDIIWSYNDFTYEDTFAMPVPIEKKRKDVAVMWAASNCGYVMNDRSTYVRELMNHIRVDSYGKCMTNAHFADSSDETFKKTLSEYKFYLSFENSNCDDYISEKMWRTIALGMVPIFMGASNVRRFTPTDDAIIDARDFGSAKELAEYINKVANDDELYKKHLSYKFDRMVRPEFLELWDRSKNFNWGCEHVGLCNFVADYKKQVLAGKPPPPHIAQPLTPVCSESVPAVNRV